MFCFAAQHVFIIASSVKTEETLSKGIEAKQKLQQSQNMKTTINI
jgi:hypothetical protein